MLEQIRDNCKELGDLKRELKDEVLPLEMSCNKLSSMLKSNFTARVV